MSISEHRGRNPKRPKIRNVRIPLIHNKAILPKNNKFSKMPENLCELSSGFLETKTK